MVSLGSALGTITNNGQIKLSNQVYQQRTQISGSGCFVAINNSTIYISNSLLPVQITQSFYLADSTSSIIVDSFRPLKHSMFMDLVTEHDWIDTPACW